VLLGLISVLVLIAINAFFVTAEFAIVSVRRSRINQLVDAGDGAARKVQSLQQSIERLLSTTQLGITLSSLALGWIGESALSRAMAEGFAQLPIATPGRQVLVHSLAIPLTFCLLAYLQIVLGELCPKALALRYSEQLARFLSAPSLAIARCFSPCIWLLHQSTRGLLWVFGIRHSPQAWGSHVSTDELQRIIETRTESPELAAQERQLLSNVFEFGDLEAAAVMVPRTSILAVSQSDHLRDVLAEMAESRFSRYPVIGESLDDVRGMIYVKDLLNSWSQDKLSLDAPIQPWVRPVRFVPTSMPLDELLPLMKRSRQPLVIVIDEYGGTAGMVTLQDMVAEILGESLTLRRLTEQGLQVLDDHSFLVQAQMPLEDVNELLGLDLPLSDAYQTLGGFVLYCFQKLPQPDEVIAYGNDEFTVVAVDGPRIEQIKLRSFKPGLRTSPQSRPSSLLE
jgi:CBS domain containing-hemolysin-like protein